MAKNLEYSSETGFFVAWAPPPNRSLGLARGSTNSIQRWGPEFLLSNLWARFLELLFQIRKK